MLLMVQIDIFLLKKKTTSQYVNPVRYIAEQVWPQRVDSQAVLLFRFDDASQRWWHSVCVARFSYIALLTRKGMHSGKLLKLELGGSRSA
jgi:hypothetical protein